MVAPITPSTTKTPDFHTPLELTGRGTAALIPGSQLRVHENAAHGLPITHADRLNHDLLAYAFS
jgi:non-heme chloroperoxidase